MKILCFYGVFWDFFVKIWYDGAFGDLDNECMNDTLILQEALFADAVVWKVHNCKLSKMSSEYDAPISLLEHYNALPDELQDTDGLSFEVLKRLNDKMSVDEVAHLLNMDKRLFKTPYQIKYVGKAVIFCEQLQIALRFHFSNTAKPYQAVFAPSKAEAISQQASVWRAFGVVDVLYKGQGGLVSLDKDGDVYAIASDVNYQSLPAEHSLAILHLLNEVRSEFGYLDERILEVVMANLDN